MGKLYRTSGGIAAAIVAVAVILAVVSLFASLTDSEAAYPEATDRFFVNDFADVMSDADEQTVYEAGVALQEATDAQVVLVTVEDTGGEVLEDYSIGLATKWGIGQEKADNGILLLFTVDGPHSRIEVGYGLEGALPDSKAGRILDTYLVPCYDNSDAWSKGLTATYRAIANVVYGEYGMTEQQTDLWEYETGYAESDDGDLAAFLVVAVVMLILYFLIRRSGRLLLGPGFFIGGHPGSYRGGGFGGGFGGGGGGFGGFSGGGGGFGGGGASR